MRRVLAACSLLALCGFTAVGATHAGVAVTSAAAERAAANQHQLVPAYFYPTGSNTTNPWHIMCRAMNTTGARSIAIVNPNSGPGTFRNPPYVEALAYCHRQQQKVIGYISTDYATRSLAAVLHEVDLYYRWYQVDGIFLDEMSNFPRNNAAGGLTVSSYYKRIFNKVKSKSGRGTYLVGNPGAPAATPWQLTTPVADNVVVFEDTAYVYLHRTPPPWVLNRPTNQVSALIKRTSADTRHQVCAVSRARNAGYVDVTNDGPPNTWDTLPVYWHLVAPHCR